MSLPSCSSRAVTRRQRAARALDDRADDDRPRVRRAQEVDGERARLALVVARPRLIARSTIAMT